jgi:hypothetical protein
MGALDVSANVQASEVETARGRPTMSSFHGFYSTGALTGALVGAVIVANGWGDGSGATTAAIVLLGLAAMGAGNLLPSEKPIESGPRFVLPGKAALGLGMLAFFGFAIEGAITDWGTLFLTGVKQATPAMAAIGYAIFALAMAAFRLFGDPVVARIGQRATLVWGGILFAAGVAIALAAPWPMVAAAGFALCGLGGANIVPVLFSEAARIPGQNAGVSVAAVATLGYTGFLVAPPTLGFVANDFGLSAALGIVLVMALVIAVLGLRKG